MYLATCAQRLLCVFGLGMMLTACDNTTEPTTKTFTADIYPQMKGACGSCHNTGGVAAKKFTIDAANAATTYTNLMTNNLINKTAPDQPNRAMPGGIYKCRGFPGRAGELAAYRRAGAGRSPRRDRSTPHRRAARLRPAAP